MYRIAEHDDQEAVLLPDHLPEVRHCALRGTLTADHRPVPSQGDQRGVAERTPVKEQRHNHAFRSRALTCSPHPGWRASLWRSPGMGRLKENYLVEKVGGEGGEGGRSTFVSVLEERVVVVEGVAGLVPRGRADLPGEVVELSEDVRAHLELQVVHPAGDGEEAGEVRGVATFHLEPGGGRACGSRRRRGHSTISLSSCCGHEGLVPS